MNAGSIEIAIAASYAQFENDLKKVAQAAGPGGQQAGDAFGRGFETTSQTYIQRTADQIKVQVSKATNALNIGKTLAAGLEEGAKGAGLGEILTNTIKSIPMIGIFASMTESIISWSLGVAEEEAKAAAARVKEEFALQAASQTAQKSEEVSKQRMRNELEQALRDDDKRRAAQVKARAEFHDIELRKQADLEEAKSKTEKQLIIERANLEFEATRKRLEDEYALIEKAEQEKEQKKADAAQKLAEQDQRLLEDMWSWLNDTAKKKTDELAKQAAARIKDLTKEAADIEKERAAAMSEVGTVSTAFGTFRFSAYTDAEKKQIDKEMLDKLRTIATEITRLNTANPSLAMNAGGIF